MKKAAIFLAVLVVTTVAASAQTQTPTQSPPVTKVVLYKHGMGYFERQGRVNGNADISLSFRPGQMRDLLTSFYAVDLAGGKISSVRYETDELISKRLEDILIKIPENSALSQFFMQLKGAKLKLKAGGDQLEGRILGIEPVTEIINNQNITKDYRLVIMTDAGPIRSVNLLSISEFVLADESLQRDLNRLLDLSLAGKYTNRKQITLSAIGQGERPIRIGYLVEMPIWKCSYRVIFDDKKKDEAPLFQGWAIAENNTEDDWKDISISFVAGNPISYIMDLYSPYYVKRQTVPIPGFQNLAVDWGSVSSPTTLDEAKVAQLPVEKAKPARRIAGAPASPRAYTQRMDPSASTGALADRETSERDRNETVGFGDLLASNYDGAAGSKVGELFAYEPKERITVPRGQAAMVPILSSRIPGQKLVFYKAAFSPRAVNSFVVRNTSDLTLEAGPITFFEGGTSLGEGILTGTLAPGSQEVIPYAIDATIDVNQDGKTKREPHFKARLADGILTLTSLETLTTTWKVVNRGKDGATLWLHQPKNTNYQLSKPEKALKEVDNHYRFELTLKPGEAQDFVVEEKRNILETVQLANMKEDQIRFYTAQKYLSPGAKKFMQELNDIMSQKGALQRQVNEWNQQTQRLTEEQTRLRSNLQSLVSNVPKEQELRAKWVAALAANEEQLADRRGKLDDANAKIKQIDDAVAKKVREYKEE